MTKSSGHGLTHVDEKGAARMVDVSAKPVTERVAVAEATITLCPEAFAAVMEGRAPKGDVLAAARIAGIMAAKKTPELIPLCHPLAITKAGIEFEPGENSIRIIATIGTAGQTGVEMEALTAASIAALTLYDMVKALDKAAVIENVRLVSKSGGKSGDFKAPSRKPDAKPVPKTGNRPKPSVLMGEVASPRSNQRPDQRREAFRAFMTSRRLRPTVWAKQAGVPSGEILGFLTGRARGFSGDVAEKLARVAKVSVEEMFR